MRKQYYDYLRINGIRDFLSLIDEIPYSKKTNILIKLREKYDVFCINNALNLYELNYFRLHRVNINIIDKVLMGLCRQEADRRNGNGEK